MTTPIKNKPDSPTVSKRWIPLSLIGLACIAVVSIYRFGFFHPAPPPEDPLRSGHQEVVTEVYKAKIEKMAPKERAEFAAKSLEDSSPILRLAALQQVVSDAKPEAINEIEHGFRDSSADIRAFSAESALNLDRERGLRLVLIGLRDEDSDVRESAMIALNSHLPKALSSSSKSSKTIVASSQPPAPESAKSKPAAPGSRLPDGEQRFLPSVIKSLDDSSPFVQTSAVSILKKFSGENWSFKLTDPPEVKNAIIHKWKMWWVRAELKMKIPAEYANLTAIRPERSDPAPAFNLTDLQGKPVSLSSQLGKVTLINFWGTWCGPCKSEIPDLQKIVQTYQGKPVEVIGITVAEKNGAQGVEDFCKKNGLTYRQAMSTPAVLSAFGGIEEVPVSVLLDQEGKIRYRWESPRDFNTFDSAIKRLLSDKKNEFQK